MNKVVISSSRINLSRFLKKDNGDYFYILADFNRIDIVDFLKEKKYRKIEIYEGLDGVDFKKEYINFIGKLNCGCDSIYWWANSISYKGTFVSDLGCEIYNYYCIISLIKSRRGDCIIVSRDFVLNGYIKRYCKENKIKCIFLDTNRRVSAITHFRRCLSSSFYFLCYGWMRKLLVSIYLSKGIRESIEKKAFYYILKTWIEKRSFSADNKYNDLFFGSLPEYLKASGKTFIILAGMLTDYKRLIHKIRHVKDFLIIPQEYFVGYIDYLKVIILSFINRPVLKNGITFCGLDVTEFLKKCLRKDYENNEVVKNLIYYYYIKGFLKRINVETFTYTFENQAWEKMAIIALRKHSPSTKIIGYAHSAISQSWLSYFYSKKEEDIVSLPDRVLTIGSEPRNILCANGNYINKVEISDSCALRYEYIFKKNKIARNKSGDILAAFSIDMNYSMKLLKFLCDALAEASKYKIILRPHPFTPLETIIEKHNIKLNNNFHISKNLKFEQDLENSSMLIYIDTTSSIEALMCGVPAIHIDFKEPFNPDPLFKLDNLKWIVSDKKGLCEKIDYIYNMDDEEYLEKYNGAMSYLQEYFYPVQEKYLERFIE